MVLMPSVLLPGLMRQHHWGLQRACLHSSRRGCHGGNGRWPSANSSSYCNTPSASGRGLSGDQMIGVNWPDAAFPGLQDATIRPAIGGLSMNMQM